MAYIIYRTPDIVESLGNRVTFFYSATQPNATSASISLDLSCIIVNIINFAYLFIYLSFFFFVSPFLIPEQKMKTILRVEFCEGTFFLHTFGLRRNFVKGQSSATGAGIKENENKSKENDSKFYEKSC